MALREGGMAHDVRKDDRDEAALRRGCRPRGLRCGGGARVDRKRSTTFPAEPLPWRVRRRARAADHLEGRSALAAELLALDVDVAAGGAGHAVTFSWLRAPSSRASQGDARSCSKISRASSRSAVSPISSPCSSSVTASQKSNAELAEPLGSGVELLDRLVLRQCQACTEAQSLCTEVR